MHINTRIQLASDIRSMDSTVEVTRAMVETVIDFNIDLEGNPRTALDNDLEFSELQIRYKDVLEKGKQVLAAYARQLPPATSALQIEYYSFINSVKYAKSIVAAGVARSVLRQAWDGINGFRA
jgi:hypothetical protein